MSATRNFLAVDLGAESGRTIVGALGEGHLAVTETRRAAHYGVHYTCAGVLRLSLRLSWTLLPGGISAPLLFLGEDA